MLPVCMCVCVQMYMRIYAHMGCLCQLSTSTNALYPSHFLFSFKQLRKCLNFEFNGEDSAILKHLTDVRVEEVVGFSCKVTLVSI